MWVFWREGIIPNFNEEGEEGGCDVRRGADIFFGYG